MFWIQIRFLYLIACEYFCFLRAYIYAQFWCTHASTEIIWYILHISYFFIQYWTLSEAQYYFEARLSHTPIGSYPSNRRILIRVITSFVHEIHLKLTFNPSIRCLWIAEQLWVLSPATHVWNPHIFSSSFCAPHVCVQYEYRLCAEDKKELDREKRNSLHISLSLSLVKKRCEFAIFRSNKTSEH